MSALKFLASALFYPLNTCIMFAVMLPFILLKLLPVQPLRIACTRVLNALAQRWIKNNDWWLDLTNPVQWDIEVPEGLSQQVWYLIISNHRSWEDILALQKVFDDRIPFLKFFIKQELIYVPVLGLAWWALDFPFMRRRGGSNVAKDLETARKACEKFRHIPTSVISFVEGTRFTPEKHRQQHSPFAHLLRPKTGGISVALETMGELFTHVLDVTLVYPEGEPSFMDVMAGRMGPVQVTVRALPVPAELLPAPGEHAQRHLLHEWIQVLWQEQDARLASKLGNTKPTA
ncbi:MAG: acyltransferase [Brachymonas sp.]|nr:acyltransferase [Brachymonas sp.]